MQNLRHTFTTQKYNSIEICKIILCHKEEVEKWNLFNRYKTIF